MPVERRGVRALQIWCRRVTESYENVNILDMDSSWRDGLAFCAIIHHFRPLLLDYYSLDQEQVLANNTLAYKVAEEQLGIPALLDPQDMLDTDIPDKFSIITYVSQFYHLLKDEDNSRSPSLPIKVQVEQPSDSLDSSPSTPSLSPPGTPSSIPRALFTSTNPILRNNKFSPHNPDLQISLSKNTILKSESGVTVSAVCEDFTNKIQIVQER